jgi:GAF domain-containing protein
MQSPLFIARLLVRYGQHERAHASQHRRKNTICLRTITDNDRMPEPDRLRGLVDAGIALSSELSLDDLLKKLAETAAGLTGARYAALGVIDDSGTGLERFVHTGIDAETVDAIGDLPRGHGILGALITDARSLRLTAITDDPRSVGFPPNHPPMRGFLGVPIVLRGRAYGNLYLTEKAKGPFTDEDQELVETLASQAAVAIENARLYEDATNWSAQLEALNEVGTALAGEIELPRLLKLISRRFLAPGGARRLPCRRSRSRPGGHPGPRCSHGPLRAACRPRPLDRRHRRARQGRRRPSLQRRRSAPC